MRVLRPPCEAFLNQRTGTFSPTSKEWVVSADQWSQTYYQLRDGKLYFVENDNKEQQYTERELDIDAFIREHRAATEPPRPQRSRSSSVTDDRSDLLRVPSHRFEEGVPP